MICALLPQLDLHFTLRANDSDDFLLKRLSPLRDLRLHTKHPADVKNLFMDFVHPRFTPVSKAINAMTVLVDTRAQNESREVLTDEDVPTLKFSLVILQHFLRFPGNSFTSFVFHCRGQVARYSLAIRHVVDMWKLRCPALLLLECNEL